MMKYRKLGTTGLEVSEIGLGAEWLERHNEKEVKEIIDCCESYGINILDCWMSEPNVRTNIGKAIRGKRERWIIQGHIGSTWQNGQYVRTRDLAKVEEAFSDLLTRLGTDYIDLGMIHFVDEETEFHKIMEGEFLAYVKEKKKQGIIHHIGMSTHNPKVAKLAALSGVVEIILFSINPAFDLLPASEDLNTYFADSYAEDLNGIDPERAELYQVCEQRGIGITVMKGYAGGRLFSPQTSPFGVALTPVQCIHYALTRPGVASILAGYDSTEHVTQAVAYETATRRKKRTMQACWHMHRIMLIQVSVLTVGTVRHVRLGSMSRWSTSCMICYDGEEVPSTIKAHYESLSAGAKDCIACGGCEVRCPFDVPVVERMKRATVLFQ